MADNNDLLTIVLKEKERLVTEMLDYGKRTDRIVSLYLTGAYAALGVIASGAFQKLAGVDPDIQVWLVFLFQFLNCCILVHATTQGAWCMALAKFIHNKLDPALLELAGSHTDPSQSESRTLAGVGALGWDDWRDGMKGLANISRFAMNLLWVVLLFFSSGLGFYLVDVPGFLKKNWLGYPAVALIIIAYVYAIGQMLLGQVLVSFFHPPSEGNKANGKKIR